MWRKLTYLVCGVVVLGLVQASVVQATVAKSDPNLVGWWKFDETGGTVAGNSAPVGAPDANLDGTLTGVAPSHVTGKYGKALKFNGTTSIGYVAVPNNAKLNVNKAITMACWVLDPNFSHTTWDCFISNSGDAAYRMSAATATRGAAHVGLSGTTTSFFDGITVIDDNSWHHVCATYDGHRAILYIDGVEDVSKACTGLISNGGAGVEFGAWSGQRNLKGRLDDVRIYNRALKPFEVPIIMNGYSSTYGYSYQYPYGPTPADEGFSGTTPTLRWVAGDNAKKPKGHKVYLDSSFSDVNSRTNCQIQAAETNDPCYPITSPLTLGTTYYWRVSEVNTTTWVGPVWSFEVLPQTASRPAPSSSEGYVDHNIVLSWTAGLQAASHKVYFGTDPCSLPLKKTQDANKTTYDPSPGSFLNYSTKYYWKVDEVNGATTWPGTKWSFTTYAENFGIRGEYFNNPTNWQVMTPPPVLTRRDQTIDFDWGQNSPDPCFVTPDYFSVRWTTEINVPEHNTYCFTVTCISEDIARVWVNGQQIINYIGPTLDANGVITLDAGKASLTMEFYEYLWGAMAKLYWESPSIAKEIVPKEVFSMPMGASGPDPYDGIKGVRQTPVTLKWQAGMKAAKVNGHELYFSSDYDAVNNRTATKHVLSDPCYPIPSPPAPLTLGQTYYWRVDEVNQASVPNNWPGSVWRFTVIDRLVVDAFEQYSSGIPIDVAWYNDPPYVQLNTDANFARSTHQSMKYLYIGGVEVHAGTGGDPNEGQLPIGSNWTTDGVKALVLHFYGNPGNAVLPMYVQLNNGNKKYYSDPNDLKKAGWHEWNIALADFSVDLAAVTDVFLGFDAGAGSGTVYFDDIWLNIPRCVPVFSFAADLDNDCEIDYGDVNIMATNWLVDDYDFNSAAVSLSNLVAYYPLDSDLLDHSGHGHNGSPGGPNEPPVYVAGKVGNAIALDGNDINDVVVTAMDMNNWSAFTLAGWVKEVNIIDPNQNRVGLFGQNDCIEFGFLDDSIHVWTAKGGNTRSPWTYPHLVWHHVAAVGDGTAVKIYVDGLQVAADSCDISNYGGSVYKFNLGGMVFDVTGNWFRGQLDEVYVFNRALSQGEIAYLAGYAAGTKIHQPMELLLMPHDPTIDINGDGIINLKDFAILASTWLEEKLWP